MKLLNRIALASTPLLMLGGQAMAKCTTEGCVDILEPKTTDIAAIIANVTRFVTNIVGAIAVLFIIWGGVLYITAAGNKERAESAKKTLTYAVIGLIVIVLAKVIVALVTGTMDDIF